MSEYRAWRVAPVSHPCQAYGALACWALLCSMIGQYAFGLLARLLEPLCRDDLYLCGLTDSTDDHFVPIRLSRTKRFIALVGERLSFPT